MISLACLLSYLARGRKAFYQLVYSQDYENIHYAPPTPMIIESKSIFKEAFHPQDDAWWRFAAYRFLC